MDKPKSKGDLRAAGKKRLEEFRQKKQQKGSSNKNSSTAIKALADDDNTVSGASVAPGSSVIQQDNKLHKNGKGTNLAQGQSVINGSPLPSDTKPESQLLIRESPVEPAPVVEAEALISVQSSSKCELVTDSISSDGSNGEECANVIGEEMSESSTDSKISPAVFGSEKIVQQGLSSNGSFGKRRLEKASPTSSNVQTIHDDGGEVPTPSPRTWVPLRESPDQTLVTEIDALKRQLRSVVEQKELVSNQLAVKVEQQLQDENKVKSLTADAERIQQELTFVQNEKVQRFEEFTSSQKELQNLNRQIASELLATQAQVVAGNQRTSLLSEDLERTKQEVVGAHLKFAMGMESMQNLVRCGEVRIGELVEELASTQLLFQVLQDEKSSLNDEVGRLEIELHKHKEELVQNGIELYASHQRIQTLEEDLVSEQKTLEQVQESLTEKIHLVEDAKVSNEKLESLLFGKEAEVGAFGEQIRHMESEKLGLVHEVEELKLYLENARQREEGALANLEAQCKANDEHWKQLQNEKLELFDELEIAKLFSKSLSDERSNLTATFDVQLEQLREELRMREEQVMKQGNQLLQSGEELHKLRGDHAHALEEMEIAVRECRRALDRQSEEKSIAIQELTLERNQLALLIEENGKEVVTLRCQLEQHKDQLRTKVEENSSLVVLLDECRCELQKTAKYASDSTTRTEEHQAISDGLLEEKGSLVAEVMEVRAQQELLEQTAIQQGLELERVRETLRSLEEDHTKLLSQSRKATDELTDLRTDKEAAELELMTYREQVTKLKEQNADMVKLLEGTQNEMKRVREDNLVSFSDLASELDNYRVLYNQLLLEKERLASELQSAIEQSELFQQELKEGKERISELVELQRHLTDLEENHSKSLNVLTVSQSETSKLREANSLAQLQVAACNEQLAKLENVNKDLVEIFGRQKEQLEAHLDEKEKLLANHVVELDKFREHQRDTEQIANNQMAQLRQLLSDLEELRNEKTTVVLELVTLQHQYQELGDQNWKVASEFDKCKDQLQILTEEKTLAESMLVESKEMEQKVTESNFLLKTELEDQRVRQQNVLEGKANEIDRLEQLGNGLIRIQDQMAMELSKTQEHSQVLEAARQELLLSVEELSKKFHDISEERNVLQTDLQASKRQLEELGSEKQQLNLKCQGSLEIWKREQRQLSRDLEISLENEKVLGTGKAQLESEVAELMRKTRDLDAQCVQLAMEVESLKEMKDCSVEQQSRLVSEMKVKEQSVQILLEEKNQLASQLQIEREEAAVSSDQFIQVKEDLRRAKLTNEELELETAKLRLDMERSQTKVQLLTKEKDELIEEVVNHLPKGEQSQQLLDGIQGIRQEIALKETHLDQLTTQCKLLQTELEVSNVEKRDLAQDLASLKHQLQQIREQKLHSVHGLAQPVAFKKHVLRDEDIAHGSSSKLEKVAQDLPVVGDWEQATVEYTQEPVHDVQSLHKLEEISKNLGQELRETLSLVGYVRLEFEKQTQQLRKAVEEVEGKQRKLDNSSVQVDELERQVKELSESAANLEAEKGTAVQALYTAQEELKQSKICLTEEKAHLEDRLRVLEGTAASLRMDRDDLAGKLATLEQSHSHLSERVLQESMDNVSLRELVAAFQIRIADCCSEMGNYKDMVAQSSLLVESLVQKLEDLVFNAFPEAGQEVALSQYNKDSADYHNFLASRLHNEISVIRHQLQDAHMRLAETSRQFQEAEDQSMALLKEKKTAVETAEQTRSQLMKIAEEKEELEIALKKLEAIVSTENLRVDEKALISANQAGEIEDLLLQIQILNKHLEIANAETGNLQTGLAQAEQKLLATREKLSLAVNKGKAVVQQRDAWKLSSAQKSQELEMLVAGHQQVLQDKETALNDAERKIADLTASLDHMTMLEIQVDSFQRIISTTQQVFLDNEDLFHSLCAMLDKTFLPDDWRSGEIAKKILWITGCVSKLQQKIVAGGEEKQVLMEHITTLASTVEKCETKVSALSFELDSVKHEKEKLILSLEDGAYQIQLERDQMREEKAQLTGIVRRLDLDIAVEKSEKEDLATRLQVQAKEIGNLEAAVTTLCRNVIDCHKAISPVEDNISAQSFFDFCKYVVKLLIDNHNLTVGKLKAALLEASLVSRSGEAVKDGLFLGFDDKLSSKEIPGGLIEKVERALDSLEQQSITLEAEQNEKSSLQMELTQKEERLNTVREKLSAAVVKGKSLVQQRDSLKQALTEKIAELDSLATAHKEELQLKELLLQEANDRLTSSLEHADWLKKDFVSFKTSVASNPDPSLLDRLSEMERQLSETHQRANAAESEAENLKKAADALLSDLELSQTKLDKLTEEVNGSDGEKNELLEQLESTCNMYRFELQKLTLERTQMISEISNLKADLAMVKEEREKLAHDYHEVSANCGQLNFQIEELLTARAVLLGDTETLQERNKELEMGLERETQARIKWEVDTEAIVARIRSCTGEFMTERLVDPMTSIPHDLNTSSQLDSLSSLLVLKYDRALQEVQELSKQNSLLSESQQTMMEKASYEREMFEQLQRRLAAKDFELSEVHSKIEEAESRRAKEQDASLRFLEEVGVLKGHLAKVRVEKDVLQSELLQLEQKGAITREKLSLAIKKGKGVAQQRDVLKQSLSEQQTLLTHYKDELQIKECALKTSSDEISVYEEKIRALELSVSSLRKSSSILAEELQEKNSVVNKLEVLLTKWNSSNEWQSKDITEKFEWLVAAVSTAESNLIRVGHEKDALKKASARLSSELMDLQKLADREQKEQSVLGAKLEESLLELEWSRSRIVELETLMAEAGGLGQQTEQLNREVLDLTRSVQQKQAEADRAEKAVISWVKRSEESEKRVQFYQGRISELEQTIQESVGAYKQIDLLNDKVVRLEEAVQQKEAAVKAMETSRGKALNKLTLTTNKFRELYQQSEGLVVELERMHKSLQDKDSEIFELKEEVAKIRSDSQISEEVLESKKAFQLQLEELLETAVVSGAHPVTSMTEEQQNKQLAVENSNGRCIAHVNVLLNQLSGLTFQSQAQQSDIERKEVQLQGIQKQLEEIVAERALLREGHQREQIQSERLKAELASMHAPLTDRVSTQQAEIEEVQVGNRVLPVSLPTPHVRGARRPNSTDFAIDVDSKMTQSVVEFDDKGHGFKSLASSQYMPRATRAIGERIDKLCVAGGRMLMRQPAARLMVTLYWLAIHIWMVFLISAAHI